MNILITVAPMVLVFLLLVGFGVWSSRGETRAARTAVQPSPSHNLTMVVPIAPTRSDRELVLSELCELARRETVLRHESVRAAGGDRAPLSNEERFVLRVLADRVDVLRACRAAQSDSTQLLLDVEALDAVRQRDENSRSLRSVPQPDSVA